MPWPRAGIVVAVVGFVLLVGGWWLTAIGSAGPLHDSGRSGWMVPTSPALMQQMQQFLTRGWVAPRPQRQRVVPLIRLAPSPHGSSCFVGAGGSCSIIPCTVLVATASAPVCSAAAPPVRAVPVSRP